jgi:hypothetical protein|tara:strand:- start:237 stop:587 length:351 start_codon:yes stop_codon:yes gene_type:complete
MGRYYDGDIHGKFWFGLQSSAAADRFGCEGTATHLDYYFDEEELPEIVSEIKKIEDSIDVKKIEDFFKDRNGYNDKSLHEAGISEADLSEYADLLLGRKIRDYVAENGECQFSAEL